MHATAAPDAEDVIIRAARVICASPERVWSAWTDPQRISEWWGPPGHSTSTRGWSFVRGGAWHFTMHGPDGDEHPGLIQFDDIHPLRRLSYESYGAGPMTAGVPIHTFVTLVAAGTCTRVSVAMRLTSSARNRGAVMPSGALEGARHALARLADFLEDTAGSEDEAPDDEPVIRAVRDVAAPRDRVWAAWTDGTRVSRWWRPNGCTTTTHAHELRPGGSWAFTVHGPDGAEHGNSVVFETVDAPRRLTCAHYVDGDGDGEPCFYARASFTEIACGSGAGTRIALVMHCASIALRDRLTLAGAIEGIQESLERFAAMLDRG